MKDRNFLKNWLLSSVVTFVIYEVLWLLLVVQKIPMDGWKECVVDFVYCALFSLSSMVISALLKKITFFQKFKPFQQMLLCLATLTLNMSMAFVFEQVYDWVLPAPSEEFFRNSVYVFCTLATLFSLVHTTYYYAMIVLRQKDELILLQKRVLKSQLDPHFVFNSLSTLAELIRQNPTQAEDYVIRLSRTYRYILSHMEHDYATLEESLDFIRDYVSLQQIRLDGKVHLDIDVPDSSQPFYLFPMALLLLVENAIKHNRPPKNETLHIEIFRDNAELVVRNNIHSARIFSESFGVGLESLRKRYLLEGLNAPVCCYDGQSFEVRVLLLKPTMLDC